MKAQILIDFEDLPGVLAESIRIQLASMAMSVTDIEGIITGERLERAVRAIANNLAQIVLIQDLSDVCQVF